MNLSIHQYRAPRSGFPQESVFARVTARVTTFSFPLFSLSDAPPGRSSGRIIQMSCRDVKLFRLIFSQIFQTTPQEPEKSIAKRDNVIFTFRIGGVSAARMLVFC